MSETASGTPTASTRRHEVRRLAIRTALIATALVGGVYLVIAAVVVAFVSSSLTAQVDARLSSALAGAPYQPPPVDEPFHPPPGDRPYGPKLLVWAFESDGRELSDPDNPSLPDAYRSVTEPTTVTIDGSELRLDGRRIGDDHVIVGQSVEHVSDARATIIFGELAIAPLLLLVVFLGAVAIGRRVATPIELARRRQLEFTADASHELRTPLSVIEAHTSLALAQPRDVTWYRSAFERVDREAKRMRRLLDDLLWLARFDATSVPPNPGPVDLGVLAQQTADRFGPIAEARNLRLSVTTGGEGTVVAASPEWLDRLLGVLLDNACKYSPEGGAVDVAVAVDGARVRLTVDDAGPGIAKDERERIFDRFHRAAGGPGGAGLGLAIADAVVRATGGRWQVGSSPAGGARMSVTWPRVLAGERHAGRAGSRSLAGEVD